MPVTVDYFVRFRGMSPSWFYVWSEKGTLKKGIVFNIEVCLFCFPKYLILFVKLKCVTAKFASSSQTNISPVYSKAQTIKINFPYKGKSIAHCFDFLQLILSFGFISSVWIAWHSIGLWEDFFSLESQNQVCPLLEISWRLVLSSFQLEITFFL